MGFFDFLRRNKIPTADSRREFLLNNGRITEGTILDSELTEAGEEVVYYIYNIQGVDFESSDILTDKQKENPIKYAPGAKVSIRYEPRNHGNCVLD
ncbi:MAG: DUF3592 domain-containing protein [Pyrinomonadaceae bacterium]